MKARGSLSLLIGLSMALAVPAEAGSSSPGFFSCSKNADGSGSCSGTYVAARNGATASDQVSFGMDNTGRLYFGAVYAGVPYSCSKNATAGSLDMETLTAATSARNYFYVTWTSAGVCSWAYVLNASGYQSLAQ